MEAVVVLVCIMLYALGLEFFLLYLHSMLENKLKKAIPMAKDYDDNLKFIMSLMGSTIMWIIMLTGVPFVTILIGFAFR